MDRTVGWLAVLIIITPFLAIPDWLLQATLTIFGLALVGVAWLGRPDVSKAAPANDVSADSGSQQPDDKSSSQPTQEKSGQQHLDIEDPDADTMMAADRWRKRSSRDISS